MEEKAKIRKAFNVSTGESHTKGVGALSQTKGWGLLILVVTVEGLG